MAKKTAKHRVKMVVELEFGYHDELGMVTDVDRLATKSEVLNDLKKEFRQEGLVQFAKLCQHNLKARLRSMSFTKFDK